MKYCISLATNMPNGDVRYELTPADKETVIECLRNHGWSTEEIEGGLADCDEGNWIPVSNTVSIC